MGIQTMASQGGGGGGNAGGGGGGRDNGKSTEVQPLTRQNSIYTLTLDEVQNQLGDLGKPLSSMNLDELLKNVWTAEAGQSMFMDVEGMAVGNQIALPRQGSLSLTGALSKKTVDEVWRDIQQNKNRGQNKSKERQPTLGEMTLEDFLVKAGVVVESSSDKRSTDNIGGVDPSITPQVPPQGQWMQYPQPQFAHPQQNIMGIYMPAQNMPQPLQMGAGSMMDLPYPDNQLALPSPLIGTLSDSQTSGRKRGTHEEVVDKSVERRQKRMIKNRESAARSRARKQAYTSELENKVSRLEEENERLRKRKELEKMLPCAPPPEPKYQLRRTTSAPF
ncbi:ABSCISIC ACID-INSENSITIVE 5-like protein 2 isoform X1 [Syzygium oleosum]|uniref:ABSCISIC ACID-INSENSITIVE 5-like protein 2 isoform X1 n=1 Tax=Syzygium oleosum TaxID=219896 RepID=UPI0011D1AC53|nr:ABSCISIC ACID-INSENSITIVE 5-like protein 2 isoform X1 [Syzygium oleosum]